MFHQVKILRGEDFEDKQQVAVMVYRLPTGQEGCIVIDAIEVMDVRIEIADATNDQILERFKAYAGQRAFLIDLLNDQHYNAGNPELVKWFGTLDPVFEGKLYLFGVDSIEDAE